jgi:hypothetical protein
MIADRFTLALIILLVVGAIVTACDSDDRSDSSRPISRPDITVVPGKDDVSSEVIFRNTELYVDIYSESGIGSAEIIVPTKNRPENLTLRMHLSGLEQIQMTYDDRVVEASVASTFPHSVRQSVTEADGQQKDIDPSSPFLLEVTIISEEPESLAKIPLKSGYFEVAVPEDFLSGQYDSLKVSWIDFYR